MYGLGHTVSTFPSTHTCYLRSAIRFFIAVLQFSLDKIDSVACQWTQAGVWKACSRSFPPVYLMVRVCDVCVCRWNGTTWWFLSQRPRHWTRMEWNQLSLDACTRKWCKIESSCYAHFMSKNLRAPSVGRSVLFAVFVGHEKMNHYNFEIKYLQWVCAEQKKACSII